MRFDDMAGTICVPLSLGRIPSDRGRVGHGARAL